MAEENVITKAVIDKLTQKDKGESNYGKEWAKEAANKQTGQPATARNSEAEQAEAEHAPESHQDEVNKKAPALAEGYTTESGRSLAEADENEFILHKGEKNFGEISKEVSAASGGELPRGYIRLKVGNEYQGLIHEKKHELESLQAGYNSIEDMIYDVCQNFDSIYKRPLKEGQKRDTYILVKFGNKEQNAKKRCFSNLF
ncbi:hypothetical protein [uncultured Phascolarctobacterium sp.]|uniref:hypothetical protein n=1 Tax=uncultured Phascolarctobacterium sp. TaxID=512296 RepID=UPI0025F114B3|nr:hypothetical protein [uncultured Phascolarctobacterium sp.]